LINANQLFPKSCSGELAGYSIACVSQKSEGDKIVLYN